MGETQDCEVKKNVFQKLTPCIDRSEEDLGGYAEALDFAFTENDLRNIAISGGYGVGKTSVIQSYQRCREKNFIYILLLNLWVKLKIYLQNFRKEYYKRYLNYFLMCLGIAIVH